jgi:hypothetical protein
MLQIHHLGLTISPMHNSAWLSQGKPPEHCPEAMLTLVVRANLGGALDVPLLHPLAVRWLARVMTTLAQVRAVQ